MALVHWGTLASLISLCVLTISRVQVSDACKLRPKVENCFVITAIKRKFFLQANDDRDLEEWVSELNNLCKITVPRQCSSQLDSIAGRLEEKGGFHPHHGAKKTGPYKTEVIGGVVIKSQLSQEDESQESTDRGHGRRNRNSASSLPAIKSGFCVKLGAVMKTWRRRFFVLSEHSLSYYKSEQDKEPLRLIHLKDVKNVKQCELGEQMMRDNLFQVVTSSRTFYVQADSPNDMWDWIQAIRRACGITGRLTSTESDPGVHPTSWADPAATTDEHAATRSLAPASVPMRSVSLGSEHSEAPQGGAESERQSGQAAESGSSPGSNPYRFNWDLLDSLRASVV
ncbi:pleckstrin homology domain-containing family A member 1-like isoform X2 [Petromyzon marinus]|uniref:pleckstrin homology domain-containing family A member 1-like isoform X2 n=1 Tax=Petromyzon marinus TaxID=7757 RepID=UPI003F6EC57E